MAWLPSGLGVVVAFKLCFHNTTTQVNNALLLCPSCKRCPACWLGCVTCATMLPLTMPLRLQQPFCDPHLGGGCTAASCSRQLSILLWMWPAFQWRAHALQHGGSKCALQGSCFGLHAMHGAHATLRVVTGSATMGMTIVKGHNPTCPASLKAAKCLMASIMLCECSLENSTAFNPT